MKSQASPGRPAGYSGTLLINKLGIKPGMRLEVVDAPATFGATLGPLPEEVRRVTRGSLDFAMVFVTERLKLEREFPRLMKRLEPAGTLWVSWPKKAAKVATDVDENVVRLFGLGQGLVDVKICAVDEVWSGLKFVRRLRDR